MNKTIHIALAIALGLALTAAAFTPPTAEQIEAAAADTTTLAALFQDASVNEAAAVAAQVADRIAAMNLPADEQSARLSQAVEILFGHFPSVQHEALATALGTALAGGAFPDGALSTIRDAIANNVGAGDVAGAIMQAFDQSFLTGGGTLPPAPNPEPPQPDDPSPPPPEPNPELPQSDDPPPPPSGPDYPGQTID